MGSKLYRRVFVMTTRTETVTIFFFFHGVCLMNIWIKFNHRFKINNQNILYAYGEQFY